MPCRLPQTSAIQPQSVAEPPRGKPGRLPRVSRAEPPSPRPARWRHRPRPSRHRQERAGAQPLLPAPRGPFLRLWNSDIGNSFRKVAAAAGSSLPVAVKKDAVLPGDDSSAASNEMEAVDEYQMFLDFAGEALFPPIDVLAEALLDTAFK